MCARKILALTMPALAAAMMTVAPAVAANDDPIRWGSVSGWDILIDPTLGDGCFIFSIFDGGTAVRLGFNPDDGDAYLMVGNQKWASIEEGKDYDVEFRMDRDSPWTATATGVDFDGLPLLMAETDDSNFLLDFAKKSTLQVRYQGQTVANVSLAGTYAAVSEMLNCQDQVNKVVGSGGDPFAGGGNSGGGNSNTGNSGRGSSSGSGRTNIVDPFAR